jgi:hypothetical protein
VRERRLGGRQLLVFVGSQLRSEPIRRTVAHEHVGADGFVSFGPRRREVDQLDGLATDGLALADPKRERRVGAGGRACRREQHGGEARVSESDADRARRRGGGGAGQSGTDAGAGNRDQRAHQPP